MFVLRRVVVSFCALAAPLCLLALRTAEAQNCVYISATGCAICSDNSGGTCCTAYACSNGDVGGSCSACVAARLHGKEELILASLMAKDAAIATQSNL